MHTDREYDELEVNLQTGLVVTRKTDLRVEDVLPLTLTRCHHAWDRISRSFGIGGNHPYDILPIGSRSPYTYIEIIMADGARLHYDRISEGTGYADAVYEHTETKTPFLESTFRWNGNGWDLRFKDGGLFVFPENYYGKRPNQGAPTAMRDGGGREIRFERDEDRLLRRIVSPSGRGLTFEYDRGYRITRVTADGGATVQYAYDPGGRLASVETAGGSTHYIYDRTLLVQVADAGGRPLGRLKYQHDRISELIVRDEGAYQFSFAFDKGRDNPPTEVLITDPAGAKTRLDLASQKN